MKISVVTVCYNSEATLSRTIESVLAQTYDNIEYLIIDGLSKDKTVEIAKSYEDKFLKRGFTYRIISEKDNGIYDAMNKGVGLATGDFVGILNSDDWYEPDAVETVVKTFLEEPFDMFYADIRLIKKDGTSIIKHSRNDRFTTSRHWNHPTSFISAEVYKDIKYRCEGIHDDFDVFLRIKHSKRKIVIRNKVLANFSVGGVSNDKSLKKCKTRVLDRYRIYRRNGYSRLYMIECIAMEAAKYIMS